MSILSTAASAANLTTTASSRPSAVVRKCSSSSARVRSRLKPLATTTTTINTTSSARHQTVLTRAAVEASSSSLSSSNTTPTDVNGNEASKDESATTLSWAPEVVNGRIAMVGFVVGAQIEAGAGGDATLIAQLQDNVVGVVLTAALVCWASIAPFKFNPQEYNANPASLAGKTGMSGFLCMTELNLKPEIELYHGRLAMMGIVSTALVELAKGSPVF